ncbi:MAG: VanZ family protein [Lachnospiraceae bacterium]|nr:VanZ family protein [Lachnospiraceae bacterium]
MNLKDRDRIVRLLFWLYIILTIKLIVFKYPFDQLWEIASGWEKGVILEGLETANFTIGKSIRMYIHHFRALNWFPNLFGNLLIFVPFGYLLPICYPRLSKWQCTMAVSVTFILGIELFQLLSAFGAFDVDDILLNALGVVLGYGVYRYRMKGKREEEKRRKIIDK